MIWLWFYLGGMALWLFAMVAAVVANVEPGEARIEHLKGVLILTPVWPFGAVWCAAHMLGEAFRPKTK